MQRQGFAASAPLFAVLLLTLGFAQHATAAFYWQDNRAPTSGKWPRAQDACRLGEAQRYMDENSLNTANYRISTVSANVYLEDESQCNYVIQRRVFTTWVTHAIGQVINFRLGEADLCLNGLTLDSDGRCAPKNDGPPACSSGAGNGTNPINGGTANKYQMERDYIGDGALPLIFERYYNSKARTPGPLASNWRSNYDRSLSISADGLIVKALRHDGRSYDFTMSGSVGTPSVDINERLVAQANGTWTLTTANNDVETYDNRGRLVSIANLAGIKQTLAYDSLNRLSTVTGPFGRTLTFGYDTSNRIVSMTDPAGGIYTYGYDANNNLTSVTYPDGDANAANNPVRTYVYNESVNTAGANLPHALTGIIDENGNRYATYQYDASGRGVSSEHAGGADKTTLTYNANGTTTVTDSAGTAGTGTARTYSYQPVQGILKTTGVTGGACNSCGGSATALSYDPNGNVASKTDFNGNLSCHTYDSARNLETVSLEGVAPGGSCPANLATYTPAANSTERKITTSWHGTYRLPIQVDEPGRRTVYAYFANGTLQTQDGHRHRPQQKPRLELHLRQ